MSKLHHPATPHEAIVRTGQARNSTPWSKEEDDTLRLAYAAGGAREAFEALGGVRTVTAIRLRARNMELPTRNWTDSQKRELRRLVREGLTIEEISSQLGRSVSAITQKAKGLAFEDKTGLRRPAQSRSKLKAKSSEARALPGRAAASRRRPSMPYTDERVERALAEAGAEMVAGPVSNRHSLVLARCRCGELVSKKAQEWVRTPDGCEACRGQKVSRSRSWPRLEHAANLAKARSCELPAQTSPASVTSPVHWRCELGHDWEAPINRIGSGHWCPKCRPLFTEGLVRSVVQGALEKPFHKVRPAFLEGLELDGFNEELSLAFEYDGEFHEDEKQRQRDLKKRSLCELEGIRLIEVSHRDGALGPDGVRRAVERELDRLKIQTRRSVWDVPVDLSAPSLSLEHRKNFEDALATRGFTWDRSEWLGIDVKVHIHPPDGGSPVLSLPRTFIAGRTPAQLAKNAKLDLQTIKDRLALRGWALSGASSYRNAHTRLDFIDPQGNRRRMTWNKWQARVEKLPVSKTASRQLTLALKPCS